MNTTVTRIPVMYRDANNYKRHTTYDLAGAITDEQITELRATLVNGQDFLPAQLGLEHLGVDAGWESFPDEDDDSAWHEMDLDHIERTTEHHYYGNAYDLLPTVEDFIAEMRAAHTAGWNHDAAWTPILERYA